MGNIKVNFKGRRRSSVDLSAPSVLLPLVWVPSKPSTLFSIFIDLCHLEKTKINKKRPRLDNLKKLISNYSLTGEILTNTLDKKYNILFVMHFRWGVSLHDPRVHVAVRRRGGRGWRTVRKVHAEVLQGARPQQHLSGRKRAHHLQQSKVRQLKGLGGQNWK